MYLLVMHGCRLESYHIQTVILKIASFFSFRKNAGENRPTNCWNEVIVNSFTCKYSLMFPAYERKMCFIQTKQNHLTYDCQK
jgi:hypothetical protein